MAKRPSILDLPVKVRELICDYAGFTGFTRDLNYTDIVIYPLDEYPDEECIYDLALCFHGAKDKITRRKDDHTFDEYWESPYDRFSIIQDLYPCCTEPTCEMTGDQSCADFFDDQATHPELFRIMLQKNHLRVCQGSPGGFQPFFELSKEVLAGLGTLTVRLDGEPPESIVLGGDWMRLNNLIPYDLRSRYGKSAMKEWKKLVDRLAECIFPSSLTLYVVTKAPDIETAEAILKPLEKLPTLKGCGLYLNGKPIPEFIALAKATVQRLTSPDHNVHVEPFRYLDLPLELRYKILEFSDLISEVDLEWKPSLSSIAPVLNCSCSCRSILGEDLDLIGHLDDCSPEVFDEGNIQRYIYDWGWSNAQHDAYKAGHCCSMDRYINQETCRRDYGGFCACYFQCAHSVYTNTVKRPRVGPHPLFLVSRQVRQDAIPIFFQRNRFVITPPGVIPARYVRIAPSWLQLYDRTIPMRRTELSLFLAQMPPNALQYIRYLEWVVPQFQNYTSAPKSCFQDYVDAVEMMAYAMHLPRLTLVLNLRVMDLCYGDTERLRWPLRQDRDGGTYDAILRPLCRLKGLKNCFVYLRRIRSDGWWAHREHEDCIFDNSEMRYEKMIMGSEYNGFRRGKPWIERFERALCDKNCNGRYGTYTI